WGPDEGGASSDHDGDKGDADEFYDRPAAASDALQAALREIITTPRKGKPTVKDVLAELRQHRPGFSKTRPSAIYQNLALPENADLRALVDFPRSREQAADRRAALREMLLAVAEPDRP